MGRPQSQYGITWTVLLEKLQVIQLVKKFPALYGTQSFATIFTKANYWSLPSAR
jgi:hypothetical protein